MAPLFLLTLILSLSFPHARCSTNEEEELPVEKVSPHFTRGASLIYDCRHQHTACVSRDDAEKCKKTYAQEKRSEESQSSKASKVSTSRGHYSCFFIKDFSKNRECADEQKRLIDQNLRPLFCLK